MIECAERMSKWSARFAGALLFSVFAVSAGVIAAPNTAVAKAKAEPKAADSTKRPDGAKNRVSRGGDQKSGPGRGDKVKGRSGSGRGRGGRPPTFVGIDPVVKGPLTQTEPVIGRFVATQQGVVAARVAGAVIEINVSVGQHVETGQILARQDTSSAEARLAYEKAELKLAEQELKRFEALRTNQSAAFARSRYDAAVHRLARAKANVQFAELAIRKAVIRAPYAGIIVRKLTELGAYLQVGAAVAELVNDTNAEIEADVPADRMKGLTRERIVTFAFEEGGKSYRAKIRAVLPMQNALTRTMGVRFAPLEGQKMAGQAINQPVTVNVPLGATRVVVSVHKDAIINRGPTQVVYVVLGGKTILRPVQIGAGIGSRFIVLAGLKPGDLVVVRGNERLRPGQAVRHRPLTGREPAN